MSNNHRRESAQDRRLRIASHYEHLGNRLAVTAALFVIVGTIMLMADAVTGDPTQGDLITIFALTFWSVAILAIGVAGCAYLKADAIVRYW